VPLDEVFEHRFEIIEILGILVDQISVTRLPLLHLGESVFMLGNLLQKLVRGLDLKVFLH